MNKPNVYIGIDPAPMSTGIAVRIGCSINSTTIKYKVEKDELCLQKQPEHARIGIIYDISDNILT